MVKIDTHVHITPPDIIRNWEKISEKEPYFSLLSHSKQNRFATAETIVEEMNQTGFDYSVVFGFSFQDMGLCQYVNDYVIEQIKAYPDQLIGFMSLVPTAQNVATEIERCQKAGLKGIGELFPAGQPFDISCHKETYQMAECAAFYHLPVIVHVNEPIGHDYVGKTHTPLQAIEAFIRHHQDLKIILAHWGGGLFMYELMKEIHKQFKNVYYDCAATPFLYDPKIYKIAEQMGLEDKILFGSDFPLLSPARYEKSILSSGLSSEALHQFYGDNAAHLLGLYHSSNH